jgi:hypothetical protein
MDSLELFPYKAPQIRKVFRAFAFAASRASATRRPAAAA